MKTAERTGAPLLGNSIGLIVALWAIDKYDWLPTDQQEYIAVAFGTIFIHILMELRGILSWLSERFPKKQ